jgi:small GTP-binding protein
MLRRTLSDSEQSLLAGVRRTLGELRAAVARLGLAGVADERALAESLDRLDELFLLVVVGEFNAGKSVFLNALLGQELLEEGVTPTTSRIHVIRYGERVARRAGPGGIEVIEAPVDLLREIELVDTPGTNAIEREHEALTAEFVPRSDFVLFVTSADRPFTESERAFLARLREWGKKVVVVLNKVDILEDAGQVAKVVDYVATSCERLLGFVPEIFPVSAKRALRAKLAGAAASDSDGAFAALERFVAERLDERERFRLKLLNPLGVGQQVAAGVRATVQARLEVLRQDFQTLDDLEGQLEQYRRDMEREFRYRLGDVDKLLHQLEGRGDVFLDDTLRLLRLPDLLRRERLERQFESQVIGEMPRQVEHEVSELIDWMVSSELRQWRAVSVLAQERGRAHGGRVSGELGALESNRRQLLDSLGQAAQKAVAGYDRRREATRLGESVQLALAGTALLEVGAVGLGSVVAAVATSSVADVTGLLAAGTLAVLGLFVIPARRRQAKRALRERLEELRRRLLDGLSSEFESEIRHSLSRLEEATAPYTRFVRAERERLDGARSSLDGLLAEVARLRSEVERS